jgi:hypothetical protein
MPLKRPYYALHQIVSGKYTAGNEFVLSDGSDYIGSYHILPNTQVFTMPIPKLDSEELFAKRTDISEVVKRYNLITQQDASRYVSPISQQPMPSTDDYEFGEIQRFFVQKRNNPRITIMEIDEPQFNKINQTNDPGINGVIWNSILIPWVISKIPPEDASIINQRSLITAERSFRWISRYVSNFLEFYK